MAQADITKMTARGGSGQFHRRYVDRTHSDACLHHAIAFERLTRWPLHVAAMGHEVIRFYNEADCDWVFDVVGIMSPHEHNDMMISILRRAQRNEGRISYQCWGEERLREKGISFDEEKVLGSLAAVRENKIYLSLVPRRPGPFYPSQMLSTFSWGLCLVFAEALSRLTNLPGAIMRSKSIDDEPIQKDQFHAVVIHPDGEVEDVWGKQAPERVARRFFLRNWQLDQEAFSREVASEARLKVENEIVETMKRIERYRSDTL